MPTPPRPYDILHFYRCNVEILARSKLQLVPLIEADAIPESSRFFLMTLDEFEGELKRLRTELDQQVVLMLVASFEAILQTDRIERVKRKKKDTISKAIRRWWKHAARRRDDWVKIEELLRIWGKTLDNPGSIGQFFKLVRHRHWLAHGRYWIDKSGSAGIDPLEAWHIGKSLFDALPGVAVLPAV